MSEQIERTNPKPLPVDRLSLLWRRINDHKMVQWAGAYVALAYAIQHGVTLTSEAFEWPHAVSRVSMLLLVLGLPLVMTFAWYHGMRASRRISGPELTIISILLVIGSLFFYVFVQPSADIGVRGAAAVPEASVAAARRASLNPASAISVAVLPFVNLSSDKEQEFFSDGMTEEITSALAKVKGLNVVARTSAFEFKGQNKDVRGIAQALSATHLIEGSVRKAGSRVRITAQLIRADTGAHLWTDSYDRELKDIFATQEDIAQAIAGALQVPLGLKPGETLVSNRTIDPESYQDYLRARAQWRARSGDYGITLLEAIIKRDPNFAPAWALLSAAYVLNTGNNDPAMHGSNLENAHVVYALAQSKAERAAREAIRLDTKSALAYSRLGSFKIPEGKWAEAEDFYRQALALDATDSDVLDGYGRFLASAGRVKEALRTRDQLRMLEPFVAIYNRITADIMLVDGQNEPAIRLLKTDELSFGRDARLAWAYAGQGQYAKAADTLLAIPRQGGIPFPRRMIEDAAQLLRAATRQAGAQENLPELGELWFVYAHIGALDRVMEAEEATWAIPRPGYIYYFWDPKLAPLRKTERFKALIRKMGLVDYWRERGWPDLCHPVGADDFVCD